MVTKDSSIKGYDDPFAPLMTSSKLFAEQMHEYAKKTNEHLDHQSKALISMQKTLDSANRMLL